jgi:hypothetical protein
MVAMVRPVSTQQQMPSILPPPRKMASAIVIGAACIAAMALIGALALWAHYGTTVFFEMIASGISACF